MRTLGSSLLVALSLTLLACEDTEAPAAPRSVAGAAGQGGQAGAAGQGGQAGGQAGAAGQAAGTGGQAAGTGGQADTGERGDPTTFPAECSADCSEACTRLIQCGGEGSTTFPLDAQECLDRCKLADKGPQGLWSNQSTNFRCCTAQEGCGAVKNCGGWLKHPDVKTSCGQVCECVFGGASIASRWSRGLAPPAGYVWSDNALAARAGGQPNAAGRSGAVTVEPAGKFVTMRFTTPPTEATLDRLRDEFEVIPTFRDAAGRFAAATGAVHVKVRDAAARQRADAALASHGLPALTPAFEGSKVLRSSGDPWAALAALAALERQEGVAASLDMLRRYERRSVPNDPEFTSQWHLKNSGQQGATPGVDGRVDEAWDVTRGDPKVVIAINDDGVDLNHPDFQGKLLPAMNYPDNWEERLAARTFGGHGTPCAGVATAASDNGQFGAGVCPDCSLLPHLLGDTQGVGFSVSDSDVAEGFKAMVDAGAWIISNSWGNETGDPNFASSTGLAGFQLPTLVEEAFEYAETKGRGGKGTVILYASGNSNDDLDAYSAYVNTIAVGAVDDTGLKAYYSSSGPSLDIAAPSNGGIQGITTTAPTAGNDGLTRNFGGTSSACPFVAGVAGLVLAANPELTAAEVRDILKKTARKIDPAGGQYDDKGMSPHYGAGLVNAAAAVQMAKGLCSGPDCVAPSDQCGEACGTREVCGECRTDADCKDGLACQAVPSMAAQLCVAKAPADGCPEGTKAQNGLCIPTRSFCGTCQATETCNAGDDNCDGQREEGLDSCGTAKRCLGSDADCPEGQVCAATVCVQACKKDTDCEGSGRCLKVKNRYGKTQNVKGCGVDPLAACKLACESVASTADDASRDDFIECLQDGKAPCSEVFPCLGKLPIDM